MVSSLSDQFVPPYNIPFRSFGSTLDKMGEQEELPSVIDRSYLSWMSGTVQTSFLSIAKHFGLINEDGVPTARLRELVYDPSSRPRIIGELVRAHYAPALELGLTATAKQLADTWNTAYGQAGDTRRKAISFFLQAAEFSGIQVSPYWEKGMTKAAGASPGKTRSRRRSRTVSRTVSDDSTSQEGAKHRETAVLASGAGEVSLVITFDPFGTSEEDRKFVFGLVDSVRQYRETHPEESQEPDATDDTSVGDE